MRVRGDPESEGNEWESGRNKWEGDRSKGKNGREKINEGGRWIGVGCEENWLGEGDGGRGAQEGEKESGGVEILDSSLN